MIYVDALVMHPGARPPFHRGSCHLFADSVDELHAFAAGLGLLRRWFQRHRVCDHYDLTPAKRALALRLGAIERSMRTHLMMTRAAGRCVVCGCTSLDCRGCIERTGGPCAWVRHNAAGVPDLCSACESAEVDQDEAIAHDELDEPDPARFSGVGGGL